MPKESFLDYAKMVGELPPETIDKLVMAVISSYPNYDKTKIISDWFRTCPPEKVQEFISICLTKSLDDAIPEIVALLGTQPTTEVEEPTIKF